MSKDETERAPDLKETGEQVGRVQPVGKRSRLDPQEVCDVALKPVIAADPTSGRRRVDVQVVQLVGVAFKQRVHHQVGVEPQFGLRHPCPPQQSNARIVHQTLGDRTELRHDGGVARADTVAPDRPVRLVVVAEDLALAFDEGRIERVAVGKGRERVDAPAFFRREKRHSFSAHT